MPKPWYRTALERITSPPPVVAVVRLAGVIGPSGGLMRPGLSASALAPVLERAFALRRLKAVALAINSPGGSAAQSSLIFRRIRALAEEKKVPVYAFAEDVAASGGYWLACAADEIYADASSIVGSIGVIAAGFGFTDLIARHGIERRLYATGPRKGMLDPFRPERGDEVERLRELQADVLATFAATVRERRGDRLPDDPESLFTGDIWSGKAAVEVGLVDGIGDLRAVMREKFGERVILRRIAPPGGWLRRRIAGPTVGGPGDWADAALAAVEERALWARFGL